MCDTTHEENIGPAMESSLAVLWNHWLSPSNFQKKQQYVIVAIPSGRVFRTRQKWHFVTIKNVNVPISWILGRALMLTSQEGSSELEMIERRGINATGDRVAALKGKIYYRSLGCCNSKRRRLRCRYNQSLQNQKSTG